MTDQALERVIARLESRGSSLPEEERAAIRALPLTRRFVDPSSYLIREGEAPQTCAVLLSGFAYRHKITGDGARQILSVHIPGEFIDLQNSLLEVADHNVQALTRCEVATVPVAALREITDRFPRVGRAMWLDTLVDAAVFREWMVNVGQRDATSRIAHLLCEFALRLHAAGLAEERVYELPMTQEQIADAVGLTPVHVNRVLQTLGRTGLISRDRRAVTIVDWPALRDVGDFNSRYLHFEAGTAIEVRPRQ